MSDQKQKLLKIELPEEISQMANETMMHLKKRGANIKCEAIFAALFADLDKKYFDKQIDRLTPDDYLLELVKQNPEAHLHLVLQAKRILNAVNRGESINKERKKPGPKPKNYTPEVIT